jgi:hypothetical protein
MMSIGPVNQVIAFLSKKPGIRRIKVLSDEERRSLLQVELAAENAVIGGRCFNEGLREALSLEFVVACFTDMNFKWPSGPYVVLKEGDTIVGFITDNVNLIKQQFNERISVFAKDLVIFPDRIRKLRGGKRTPTLFIHKGFKMSELEKEANVKNAVLAFCTRAGDACLKKLLKEEKLDLGSIVIGFEAM